MKKTIILSIALLIVTGSIAGVVLTSKLNRYAEADDGTRLPKVTELEGGLYEVAIPDDPKPAKSYTRVLKPSESPGKKAAAGDVVSIHFQLVGWENQQTSEVTRKLTPTPIKVEAGLDNESLFNGGVAKCDVIVPQYLSDALVGTSAGERKLVVFPENTPDLPVHLPREDAYALVVDIVEVH